MAHTPGPWEAIGPWVTSDAGMLLIVGSMETGKWQDDATREANARLIAYAPDLLSACEALMVAIQQEDPWDSEAAGLARAAITKARGT